MISKVFNNSGILKILFIFDYAKNQLKTTSLFIYIIINNLKLIV